VFFCRYGSFAWALNSLYFVAISAFNNLGHATWSTAFSWLRTTLGTIPFVLLGSHLGGAEGVIVGQAVGNVIFAVLAIVVCYRVLAKPPRLPAHAAKR
jgi:Na+-driven multidrug efflux pump